MIITAGYLTRLSTLVDGSVKIEVGTQEITPDAASELFRIRGKYVKVILSEENISTESLDAIKSTEVEAPIKGKKSASQRLRATLYRLWEQQGSSGEFDEFYEAKMEQLITHFKDKLS